MEEGLPGGFVYGVFTKEDKAKEIRDELCQNFEEHGEECDLEIQELELDQPTENYHFMMNN